MSDDLVAEIPLCGVCGEKHQRCNPRGEMVPTCPGHTSDGLACHNFPIKGGTVCYQRHGGKAPQVQEAARNRLDRERAEKAVATLGLPRDVDPFVGLKEEIARTAGHIAWLDGIIGEMEPIDLVWGEASDEHTTSEGTGMGLKGLDTTTEAHTHRAEAGLSVWLRLYQDERKHFVQVCKTAIQCGLAEREVKILEAQGKLLADVFRAFIDDPELALDADTRQRMRQIASRHLRAAA